VRELVSFFLKKTELKPRDQGRRENKEENSSKGGEGNQTDQGTGKGNDSSPLFTGAMMGQSFPKKKWRGGERGEKKKDATART